MFSVAVNNRINNVELWFVTDVKIGRRLKMSKVRLVASK